MNTNMSERKELSFIYSFLNRVIQPNYTTYSNSNLVNREKKINEPELTSYITKEHQKKRQQQK